MKTETKWKPWIIDLQAVKALTENTKNEDTEISQNLRALPGLNASTSCDTISAFFGKERSSHLARCCKMEVLFSCFLPLVLYGLTDCKRLLEDKNEMFNDNFSENVDNWNDWHEQSLAKIKLYWPIPGQCPLFISGVLMFSEGIVL